MLFRGRDYKSKQQIAEEVAKRKRKARSFYEGREKGRTEWRTNLHLQNVKGPLTADTVRASGPSVHVLKKRL